jgi:hypothetical protein
MLRISLRRSRADWPIVAAAGLICLLAAALLAAGSIYAEAVSTAGLHRILADARPADADVEVTFRAPPGDVAAVDTGVTAGLNETLEPPGTGVVRVARSDSFALPNQPAGEVRNLAVIGYAEALAEHATLVSGSWPEPAQRATPNAAVPVAISTTVAGSLGLHVGDQLALVSRTDAAFSATIRIAAIFRIDDPSGAYWWDEAQVVDGVVTSDRYTTYGPFFTTQEDLLARATPNRIELRWRASPAFAGLGVRDLEALAGRVRGLEDRLTAALGPGVGVTTGLPRILTEADRSLLVSRAGVLLVTIQLVVLAAYAVLLSASLLIERRRIDTAMLRSRGAGRWRIVGLTAIEATVLTVPILLVAPWVAVAAVSVFNLAGPLADAGLVIRPAVGIDAYVAAGAAAAVCFAALVLPQLRSSGQVATTHAAVARGETTGIGQRLGIDVALLAVAGVGFWQLRQYGAPLTRSVQGTLGLDPLLIATPAIGLLAGGMAALRIVPLLAQVAERATTGRRGLVSALGARQLARRPLRYTRAALLLMLAMAVGVFAICYAATWTESQADQATFQVGADIRVAAGRQVDSVPAWALDAAYGELAGVHDRLPIGRATVRVGRSTAGGAIVATDPLALPAVASLRADLAADTLPSLAAPLAAGRPGVQGVPLPGTPTQLRVAVDLAIRAVEHQVVDPATGVEADVPAELDAIASRQGLGVSAVVRDARGILYRFAGGSAKLDRERVELIVPLGSDGAPSGARFSGPLELLALEIALSLPEAYRAPEATLTVQALAAAGPGGDWTDVPLALSTGWRATSAYFGRPHQVVSSFLRGAELVAETGSPGLPYLPGVDRVGRGLVLTFAPASLTSAVGHPVAVIASDAFLEASASLVGDDVPLTIGGVRRTVHVSGSLRAVPGTDPREPIALMDLASLSLLEFEGNDAVQPVLEWWLAVAPGASPAVAEALGRAPFSSATVETIADRSRALATDPVALGIIGALAIGFVAAALFAVVGFMVSAAVSARERITEFALLEALGLSSRQLAVWLSLENAALAAISLVAGSLLGLVMAWVVLPFITVTSGATVPYPPVVVVVPWAAIAVLEVCGLVALSGTVALLSWLLGRLTPASVLRMSAD